MGESISIGDEVLSSVLQVLVFGSLKTKYRASVDHPQETDVASSIMLARRIPPSLKKTTLIPGI